VGAIYGAAVFIVMNFVVLPHTAVVKSPLSLPLLLNGFSRTFCSLAYRSLGGPTHYKPVQLSTQRLNYGLGRIHSRSPPRAVLTHAAKT